MNAQEYLLARQSNLVKIDHEEFAKANGYLEAAMRLLGTHHVPVSKDTVAATNDVALRLMEMYPEGMPATYEDVMERGGVISAEVLAYWKTGKRVIAGAAERTWG